MIDINSVRPGMTILYNDRIHEVVEFQHVKPGKGGAFVRTRLKDYETGTVQDVTFRAGIKIEQVIIDKREMEFLYRDGDRYVFMDTETFDQVPISGALIEKVKNYLTENLPVTVRMHQGKPVGIDIPDFVQLKVTQTDPGVRGDTASGGTKPATLETGLTVQVPLFVSEGDVLKIDTRTGKYVERV